MLQKHACMGLFLLLEYFPAKTGVLLLTKIKKQQFVAVRRKAGDCNLKLLANNTVFSIFTLEGLETDDALTQIHMRNISLKGKMKNCTLF